MVPLYPLGSDTTQTNLKLRKIENPILDQKQVIFCPFLPIFDPKNGPKWFICVPYDLAQYKQI